jgi:hypothetical protein
MVALSGTGQAQTVYDDDDFDKTRYIYSYFRLIGVKEPGLEIKQFTFKKHILNDKSAIYTLSFVNTANGYAAQNRFSLDNDFLIKFDNNEIYALPVKNNLLHMWGAAGSYENLAGFHEIVLNVPESVLPKILTSSEITLRIPLAPEDPAKTSIRSITFTLRDEIVSEWRQVIRT